MKRYRFAGITALAFIAFLVASYSFGPASAQVGEPTSTRKWEYRFDKAVPSEAGFNHWGAQGRELCETVNPPEGDTNPRTFIFKRPLR